MILQLYLYFQLLLNEKNEVKFLTHILIINIKRTYIQN